MISLLLAMLWLVFAALWLHSLRAVARLSIQVDNLRELLSIRDARIKFLNQRCVNLLSVISGHKIHTVKGEKV